VEWLPLLGIVVAIVVPIGLAVHRAGRARSERNAERLDAHIVEDVKAHERLAKVETRVERLEIEQERTRDAVHDLRDTLPQKVKELVEWFKNR
jgi:hypothetical protein